MHYELLTSILILVGLFLLGIEYLWLYILASKEERHNDRIRVVTEKLHSLLEGIIYSPTQSVRLKEIELVKDLVDDKVELLEVMCTQLELVVEGTQGKVPTCDDAVRDIYNAVEPTRVFSALLENGTKYEQGYACRRLADFGCRDYLERMRDLSIAKVFKKKGADDDKDDEKKKKKKNKKHKKLKHADRDRAYSAAMALSRLGDLEGVVVYIKSIQVDKRYSSRIINELFDVFEGDKAALAAKVFEDCDDYIRCTVIKAITKYKFTQFEAIYKEGITASDRNTRISCVKALGALAKPENQHVMIVSSKDNDWVVRISAIAGLQELRSAEAIKAVKEALKDKEWWVRQRAATALLNMSASPKDLEDVIFGYDRYASDALKYALYKTVDMR